MEEKKLIWIDLEMTGLDYHNDVILEIATIVTNQKLEIIEEGPNLVIHHEDSVLENMDPWCIDHHGKTGLTQAVKDSHVSMEEAEQLTIDFISQYCEPGTAPICGNSVWFDRLYLDKDMPDLAKMFHYRVIDVSSFKTVLNMWDKRSIAFPKTKSHRALDDIKESIAELKFYQKFFISV
jgi:oligoribonuclease